MPSISVKPLHGDLPFGARISGVDRETLKAEGVRRRIKDAFEDRGVVVFEDVEPSGQMQLALSDVIGPLQDHAIKALRRVNQDLMPGVVDLDYKSNIYEIDGKVVGGWLPWHFDACYTKELNRGAVLRAIDIPPEGGETGFADGVQLYNAISPELRAKFEGLSLVYHEKLMFMNQRFGMPRNYRVISLSDDTWRVLEAAEGKPRAIHPAIWKRKSGEKVLHVSPWQCVGIAGHEDPEGDSLLEALFQDMYAKMTPYFHKWKPTDMLAWDNWRFLHSVDGNDPGHSRRVHRTTIKGDYGLGRFEHEGAAVS
jgi:taurine dioxygenase